MIHGKRVVVVLPAYNAEKTLRLHRWGLLRSPVFAEKGRELDWR